MGMNCGMLALIKSPLPIVDQLLVTRYAFTGPTRMSSEGIIDPGPKTRPETSTHDISIQKLLFFIVVGLPLLPGIDQGCLFKSHHRAGRQKILLSIHKSDMQYFRLTTEIF